MVIFSLASPLKRLKETGSMFSLIGQDDITVLEKRYSELRRSLPQYGTVGYIINNRGAANANDTLQYNMVKYAVAPVLVADDSNYEYVIGNFYRDDIPNPDIIKQMEKNGFKIVAKIDDRLVLFRRILQ